MKLTGDLPVMPSMCGSCPFRPEGDREIRAGVEERCMTIGSQHCHSTGWPEATHLCRGARNHQLTIFHRLGVLPQPTDECWQAVWEERKRIRDSESAALNH